MPNFALTSSIGSLVIVVEPKINIDFTRPPCYSFTSTKISCNKHCILFQRPAIT